MRIVYMGTPDFAVGPLKALVENGYEVVAVVTQPDRPKGRSDKLIPSPVKECALEYNLPVFQPEKIKTSEAVNKLREYQADLFVVAAFGQIMSQEILDMPRFGCINIHASLLPKYRGAAPIQWSIIDGEKETGVTIMQMDIGIDTGDIMTQKVVPIEDEDTGETLFDKLCVAGAQLLVDTIPMIEKGEITPVKQDESKSTHAKMLKKEMGNIDFAQNAHSIWCLVRGLNSWPSAYTYINGKMMKIWKAKVSQDYSETTLEAKEKPGTVCGVFSDHFDVVCLEGALSVYEIQLEGKKRTSVKEFLLGHKMEVGTVLGQ